MMRRLLLPLCLLLYILPLSAANDSIAADSISGLKKYMPKFNAVLRVRYEYEPDEGGRFQVRTARLGVQGIVHPKVHYLIEADFCDEGKIRMQDAYMRYFPVEELAFTMGQFRVPFGIDAHRLPQYMYFANRPFLCKQAGSIKDVGAMATYQKKGDVAFTLQGGIFNGCGFTEQKDYWTTTYNYSFKAQMLYRKHFNLTLSTQRIRPDGISVFMHDFGGYYDDARWHFEVEYLRKCYRHAAFKPVNALDAFAVYRIPLKRELRCVSLLGRYDWMSDNSNGVRNEQGLLYVNNPARHRMTLGTTLSFGKVVPIDIKLNYEKYFYKRGIEPARSEKDKYVAEIIFYY